LTDNVDDEVFRQAETSVDLPDVPIAGTQTLEEIQTDKERHDFIATLRMDTDFTGRVDPRIYRLCLEIKKDISIITTRECPQVQAKVYDVC